MMDAYSARDRTAGGQGGRTAALARYVVAATLARAADGGAAVGIVLLAVDPATHLPGGARTGGLLAVGLTAPHVLGPWTGRRLDAARDGRRLLAGACLLYGLALAAATAAAGHAWLAAVAAALVVAGSCGPLLTGGLSSRLAAIAGPAARRAEGWDAVTYGLGGTAGPAAVAALAGLTSPRAALLALAGASAGAGLLVLSLPAGRTAADGAAPPPGSPPPVRAVLRLALAAVPLRRVTLATLLTSFSLAGLASVIAVLLGAALSGRPGAGAALAAAFGLGNLAGSLLVTAVPPRMEPERLAARAVAAMAACLAVAAAAPGYGVALAAFALTGASNAPFFMATLAVRSRTAPPGARAQVFVSLAAAKVASGAAGTAAAGLGAPLGPRPLLAAAAALTFAGALGAGLGRAAAT